MGSMNDSDRKRRHFSSLSPTPAAATAKKLPFLPVSEDKKLDIVVLQYQNQKLTQKLETQKLEYAGLENRFSLLKESQKSYDSTLAVVKKSWEQLVDDLELCSERTRESSRKINSRFASIMEDGSPSTVQDVFLSRLMQTDATECASTYNFANQMEEHREITTEKAKSILKNMVTAVNNLWVLMDGLHTAFLKKLPGGDLCRQKLSSDLEVIVKNLRLEFSELHSKHKSLASEFQIQRDLNAKNKADLERLKGELASTVKELEESNHKLATLKAERDAAKGVLPLLNVGSTHIPSDKIKDKQKDLQDMESTLKELLDQGSARLMELKSLHEERIRILQQLCDLQNTLKNLKCITSSHAFQLVRDQIEKSKAEVLEYQALYEKLQVEKDNLAWREREWYIKNDLADVFQRSVAVSDFRVADLRFEIQKKIEERYVIENKLKEEARGPGRKQIIAEFKSLVSSFPDEMGSMQIQLRKYKESASDIHSLRADVKSVSSILDRKVKECDVFSVRSAGQLAEIKRLLGVVQDLRESERDLKLILVMFRRESIDSRDVMDAREAEYRAWARVQSLKSSLDEHNLEHRVKTANEAEARSQQKLATAEAEIADMRQKLEDSKRQMCDLSDVLKSKNKQNENYMSEIESIGQAYDDMQTQNQHLLQQITERDDYNIKLVLEGVRARQKQDSLLMEKRVIEHEIQQANISLNVYDVKATRIEDQLKFCLDQLQKLAEDKLQSSVTLENTQRRLSDVRRQFQQVRDTVVEMQSKIGSNRVTCMELQVELEKERFAKKRVEEDLEVARRKFTRLKEQNEGSSVTEKLQEELEEYRDIIKCSICQDRAKEVVITKCYHLFCYSCIQKVAGSRHRKCPQCSTSFGANDVKSVYL
ncbi:E3 ubiquitin-protein ligase BRE1-like 1 isoform X1 [Glycine soja]|uniref:E3 ubiquitin protein ligase n=2 Tax=Glycine soja TaxID=3848 RepID=A0A0B2Q235_GLYSO|nr:E3 ubiquitin-protein ligase BRE1-like 1 isoform X1 [Glycine soja]KHN15380.1 E3 ubiquitin-protein ligase BRE1-like 1 [Glycine soja]RZB80898.1 E3 ubiquitin-protein ligase BRE1-like 1 isoform A [Glycine soja]